MPRPSRLLSSGGLTIAFTTSLLLFADGQPARDFDLSNNTLCIVAPATPYDPASGLPMYAPRPVPADARCPVCGMYPARHPRWAAQIIFKNGAAHYFDSPVNLFDFLHKVDRYDRRYTLDDVAASYVRDLESGQWIKAGQAHFVHGSAVIGPMRTADLPAFASRTAADAFARQHRGTVLTAADMTPRLLASLSRNGRHRH
ncbi:MAG: nitrous oxide reductase accessory protein NosL [Betaproteobacteria bacterium]|nr:nitrous oxide reductase accessory protein NosL [Betaproteobacteria bacterium]